VIGGQEEKGTPKKGNFYPKENLRILEEGAVEEKREGKDRRALHFGKGVRGG